MDERQALQAVIDRIQNEDSLRTLRSIAFDLLSMEECESQESLLQELEAIVYEVEVKLRNIAFDLLEIIEERERRKMYLAPENWLSQLPKPDNESWLQELEAIDDDFDVK